MEYSAFDELMSYFHIVFNVYYLLLAIILLNTIKAIRVYLKIKNNKGNNLSTFKLSTWDLIVNILCMFGLWNGLMFQGVLADIPGSYGELYFNKLLLISVISVLLFLIHLVFMILIEKNASRNT